MPQQTFENHPRGDIWRSETVLVVFIDMWLNNDQIIDLGQNYNNNSPTRVTWQFLNPKIKIKNILSAVTV